MLKVLTILFVIKYSHEAEIDRIYNYMLITEESNNNIETYWEAGYSDNDPNGEKHTHSVYDVIPHGNFRSAMVDDWFLDPPHETALLFFNLIGDLHYWMVFDTSNTTSGTLKSWMTKDRLLGTSYSSMPVNSIDMRWDLSEYQFSLCSTSTADYSWFAVADRNLRNNSNIRPYFVIPMSFSNPFAILADSETAGNSEIILIKKWGLFMSVSEIEIDIAAEFGPDPIYVSEIDASNLVAILGQENMIVEYSIDHCSVNNRVPYRDLLNGSIKILKTNFLNKVELLYIRCIWITFERVMLYINVKLYKPAPVDDFLTLPLVLFRGFWFTDSGGGGTLQSVNYLLTTLNMTDTPETTFSATTIPKTTTESHAEATTTTPDMTTTVELTEPTTINLHLAVTTIQPDVTSELPDMTSDSQLFTTITNSPYSQSTLTLQTCSCGCIWTTGATFDLQSRLVQLKKVLSVNKTSLSSYRRKLISVKDHRTSSLCLGFSAGVLLSIACLIIVMLDLSSLCRELRPIKYQVSKDN